MEEQSHGKRVRDDSAEFENESVLGTTKMKRIKDDLLSLLDDSDSVPDRDMPSHDLDSVIRSFEEEISGSGSVDPLTSLDLASGSGNFPPEIGTELPSETLSLLGDVTEFVGVSSESPGGIAELWNFQDELTSYDSFGFGVGCYGEITGYGDDDEYVALDGIFDYNFGPDLSWRPETLPAL